MLKKLFYASASILMLALAYHFGATSAKAQGGTVTAADVSLNGYGNYSVVIGRTLYAFAQDSPPPGTTGTREVFTVPGTSPVIACTYYALNSQCKALLENGDCWTKLGIGGPWNYQGNVFGTSTPAAQQTFGQLKAQYRK